MSFQITLSGRPVESNVIYATAKRAEHVAACRYSDPPVTAPACPHIPRRTWLEKGYRVERAQPWPENPPDTIMESLKHPSPKCPGGPVLAVLPQLWKRPAIRPSYEQTMKLDHRDKMERFRARQHFQEMERREGRGANDSQCWKQMSNGLPCLLPRGHEGPHTL